MIEVLKDSLWSQFGASINMLENAITLWPDEEWTGGKRFFYTAYHCLIFLDYYLTNPPESFEPLLPFTITEKADQPTDSLDDVIPNSIYSKQELLGYLQGCRQKCRAIIANLTEARLQERWVEEDGGMNYSMLEILLYNMRHVQHHAAQLNLYLRQTIDQAPGWVARAVHAEK